MPVQPLPKRKRGRPPLSDEEKKRRMQERLGKYQKNLDKRKASCAKSEGTEKKRGSKAVENQVPAKRPIGAPTKYRPEFVEQARKLTKAGFTDYQMCEWFGVTKATFYSWTAKYQDFLNSVKLDKDASDERVERSLYHRATGYSYEAEKVYIHQGKVIRARCIEHVPPDTAAMIFWLKNRRPAAWRDKKEVELSPHENWMQRFSQMEDTSI